MRYSIKSFAAAGWTLEFLNIKENLSIVILFISFSYRDEIKFIAQENGDTI